MSRGAPRRRTGIDGLSLIELLIALLIGMVMVLGLVQVFAASRTAYMVSQGIARSQESARFALDFLSRDLRMVGHAGCVNDQGLLQEDASVTPALVRGGNIRSLFLGEDDRNANNVAALPFALRFDVALQGFEAAGTGPGASIDLQTVPAAGDATDWSPQLPAEIAALSPVAGSDVVMLRFFSPEQAQLSGLTPGATTTVSYDAASSAVATEGGGLFALADCGGASVFQASAPPDATSMTVSVSGLNQTAMDFVTEHDGSVTYRAGSTTLYRAESMAYYVALNGQRVPSLYRTRWTSTPGSAALTPVTEELVEGVESLQLLYGEDANSETLEVPPSGYITKTNTADTIGDATSAGRWRRVGAVQIGLMVRGGSIERSASEQATTTPEVLQVTMNAPEDGHYRSAYETTIALRNRLFGN